MAPDRDRQFAAKPIVSVHAEDEPAYRSEVERREVARFDLARRGVEFGTFAMCEPAGLLDPRPRRRRREALIRERWVAARPLHFPAAYKKLAGRVRGLARGLYERLERGEFTGWLESRASALGPRFQLDTTEGEFADPERDLARATFSSRDGLRDFWIKWAKLSPFERDTSRRLRLSFGAEGDDDASTDGDRLRALTELGAPLVPGFREISGQNELEPLLVDLVGAPLLLTQPIGYWNTKHGGAAFHHDSFAENDGQKGVLFVQLVGRSFWLALAIRDLADRLAEYASDAAEHLPEDVVALCRDPLATLAECGLPDCGRLNGLVNAPEFTAFLADAGHAVVLEEGDAIVLPNHDLNRTAMHSVFGTAKRPSYGLSLAIRAR